MRSMREDIQHWTDRLTALSACPEVVRWARNYTTPEAAWNACERGDWLLWVICHLDTSAPWSEERKPIVRAACACARLVLPYVVPSCEERPRKAVEIAEAWTQGKASIAEVEMASSSVSTCATFAAATQPKSVVFAASYAIAYAVASAGASPASKAASYAVTYTALAADAYATAAAEFYADAYIPHAIDAFATKFHDAPSVFSAVIQSRAATYRQCADIVRQHFSVHDIAKKLDAVQ